MRPLLPIACLLLGVAANAGCATAAVGSPPFEQHTDDYDRVRGEYALGDGHALYLVGTRRHPRIEFDDGTTRALTALSATEFVTTDGCTWLVFEAHGNATVTRVGVTHPPACAPR